VARPTRYRPTLAIAAAAFAGALFLPARARAQDSERDVAAQFFEAGAAAAKRGEYRVCAEAFTEAHKRAPVGATIYNAGLCWQNANELPRAANDYKEALRIGVSGDQAEQAKKRLAALGPKLGEIEVTDPQGQRASVGPIKSQPIPFSTFVSPGENEVRVEGPEGEIVTRTVSVEAGEKKSVSVELEGDKEDTKPPPPRPEPEQEPGGFSEVQAPLGWALIGVSAVAAGAGYLYWTKALDAKDRFETHRDDTGAHDSAVSNARTADILWVGAGLGAVGGIALVLTAPKAQKPDETSSALTLRVHPMGASALFTF
jgi:tetratricopeptide (TPR) repeat protein